jgi:hypothetical protein
MAWANDSPGKHVARGRHCLLSGGRNYPAILGKSKIRRQESSGSMRQFKVGQTATYAWQIATQLSAPGIDERTIRGDDNTNLTSQPRTEPERRYVIRIGNPDGQAFCRSDRGKKPFLVGKLFLRSVLHSGSRAQGLVAAPCPGIFHS